jgi:hypothetical protein
MTTYGSVRACSSTTGALLVVPLSLAVCELVCADDVVAVTVSLLLSVFWRSAGEG